jgi:transposase
VLHKNGTFKLAEEAATLEKRVEELEIRNQELESIVREKEGELIRAYFTMNKQVSDSDVERHQLLSKIEAALAALK